MEIPYLFQEKFHQNYSFIALDFVHPHNNQNFLTLRSININKLDVNDGKINSLALARASPVKKGEG